MTLIEINEQEFVITTVYYYYNTTTFKTKLLPKNNTPIEIFHSTTCEFFKNFIVFTIVVVVGYNVKHSYIQLNIILQ